MQATNILSSVDKQNNGQKPSKSAASVSSENSFNQLLSKEISSGIKSDSSFNNNVSKSAPAPKTNNANTNNTNTNNNNSNNNVNNSNNNNPAPKQTTDSGPGNTANNTQTSDVDDSKPATQDEDKDTSKEQDISAQILALVGNLAPVPVSTDTSKVTASDARSGTKVLSGLAATALDAGKNASDAAIDSLAKFADTQIADALNAASNKPGTLATDAASQSALDSNAVRPDLNAIAAQLIAGKADPKSGGTVTVKTVTNSIKASKPAAETGLAIPDTNGTPLATLAAAPKELATSTGKNTTEALTDTKTADTKPGDAELISKVTEKTVNSSPETGVTDNSKTFANDIAQARDLLADKISETKLTATGKDIPIAVAPPPAQAAITGLQVSAANTFAADHIGPRVGSTGWDKAVGQKVVWMVGEAMQSAELTLNPPDLGPLQVVLKLSNEQASASFTAAQPEVREALEAALPRLKQMLSDAGVQLTGFSVNSQAAGQNQNQGFEQQQARTFGTSRQATEVADTTINSTGPATAKVQLKNGLVDTFA
ncbi:flagellar hook-length control protein FliK [Undibacterium sp. TJN19]|uniref:flagellar hook-length control protein FliK n=1 Tax=Undibacterium sp. TJN19 TaxID=3413055 RepID=UPI003BF12C5C